MFLVCYGEVLLVLFLGFSFIDRRTLVLALDSDQRPASFSTEYSANTLAKLYATIRNAALPSAITFVADDPVSQRLVMLLPGKVLNYYDYFPGEEEETGANGQGIPPRVLENMFQLSDVVPGIYPLRGAETGESMAAIYKNILYRMEVKQFGRNIHRHSDKIVQLLKREVADPRSTSRLIPLYQLYNRSKASYIQSRVEMENSINDKRQQLSQSKFEEWYRLTAPVLKSKVEGAHTELQMIQRKLHDYYKLDVDLTGLELEEAKVALRSFGLRSVDRSRTIYPVSFTPPHWYKYLKTAQQKEKDNTESFSRDQFLVRIGNLLSKKGMLEAFKNASSTTVELEDAFSTLTNTLSESTEMLSNLSWRVEELRQRCYSSRVKNDRWSDAITPGPVSTAEYEAYENGLSDVHLAILDHTELYACYGDVDYQVNGLRNSYQKVIEQIDTEIKQLQEKVKVSAVKLTNLARQVGSGNSGSAQSEWLPFQFDSKSTTLNGIAFQYFSSTAANYGANIALWSVKSSQAADSNGNEDRFRTAMNRARVKVKGELLRVSIHRPWFKPSLFKNKDFIIKDKKFWVSPGPVPEDIFISTTRPGVYPVFQLPQYVSGLLLSRNIEMEFDVQVNYSTQAVRESTGQLLGGFAFWRASLPSSFERVHRAASVQTSDTGVSVSIPGVQLIGYYTSIVSRFPHDIPLNFLK